MAFSAGSTARLSNLRTPEPLGLALARWRCPSDDRHPVLRPACTTHRPAPPCSKDQDLRTTSLTSTPPERAAHVCGQECRHSAGTNAVNRQDAEPLQGPLHDRPAAASRGGHRGQSPAHKQKARQRRAFWCIHHHVCQAWARKVEEECKLLGCGFSSLLGSVGSSVSGLLGGISSSVSGGGSSVSSRSGGSSGVSGRSSRSGSFHSRSGGSSRSFFLLAASSQSSSSDHGSQNERLLHDNFLLRMSYSVCRTG